MVFSVNSLHKGHLYALIEQEKFVPLVNSIFECGHKLIYNPLAIEWATVMKVWSNEDEDRDQRLSLRT